jgi:molybdenum cofactor cytidylyltransferase
MTFALIPAAGESRRMGRPKLSLPLAGRTVLECVIAALREAGIEYIIVVVSPAGGELAAVAQHAGAAVCLLTQQTADMRATVEQGLSWLETQFHPRDDEHWLLIPADHPTLDANIVRRLRDALVGDPAHSIAVPVYQGARGHPLILLWKHVADIRKLPPHVGLNAYVREHSSQVLEVPVDSLSVMIDLDTPEDYERLRSAIE